MTGRKTNSSLVARALLAFGLFLAVATPLDRLSAQTQNLAAPATPVPQATPAPPAKEDESPWKAVERIDNKIANMIQLLLILGGIAAGVIALYELVKVVELRKLKKHMEEELILLFERRFSSINKDYERKTNSKFLKSISKRAAEIADEQLHLSTIAHRVMLSFVRNDLPGDGSGHVTMKGMYLYTQIERALIQIRTSSDDENMIGLTLLTSLARNASDMTINQMLEYLIVVRRARLIQSWPNQELCNSLIVSLSARSGIAASDIEASLGS